MNVTRDVIYDLLPAYFSDEVSADTRALIEEFFTTDPEFGRMAERFRRLHDDRQGDARLESETDRERQTFDHVKTRVKRRQAAVLWAMGSLMGFGMAMDARSVFRHPGMVVGFVFAIMAAITWLSSRSAGTWAAALTASADELAGSGTRRLRRARKQA